jgi:hypothetical protein
MRHPIPTRVGLGSLLLALSTFALPQLAHAGPWEVGSTSPSKSRKIKAEVTWKHTDSKDTWARPIIKIGGPLNSNLSYEVGGGYGIIEKANGTTRSGARDLTGKLKWRFLTETATRPAFLVEPKFTFNTGDATSGVGGGVSTLKTPVRAGKQFGDFRLTGEVFYTHGFAHRYDDTLGYGGLLEYSPNDRWILGVDVINDRPVDDGGRYHVRTEGAFKFKLNSAVELQGLIGRSVENRRGELATNAKFVMAVKF